MTRTIRAEGKKFVAKECVGQSRSRVALCQSIEPMLLCSTETARGMITNLPKTNNLTGVQQVLEVISMFDRLDTFARTHHWSSWKLMQHLWAGDAYEGKLQDSMQGAIKGKAMYLAQGDLSSRGDVMDPYHVMEMSFQYFKWKVMVILKAPAIPTDSVLTKTLRAYKFRDEVGTPSEAWRRQYEDFRNEYITYSMAKRESMPLYDLLKEKFEDRPASNEWLIMATRWRAQQYPETETDTVWTVNMLDRAITATQALYAENGVVSSQWRKFEVEEARERGSKAKRSMAATTATAMPRAGRGSTTPQGGRHGGGRGDARGTFPYRSANEGSRGSNPNATCVHCLCFHKSPGSIFGGCAFRAPLVQGAFTENSMYAGYLPQGMAKQFGVYVATGIHIKLKRMDPGYATLEASRYQEYWGEYCEARIAEINLDPVSFESAKLTLLRKIVAAGAIRLSHNGPHEEKEEGGEEGNDRCLDSDNSDGSSSEYPTSDEEGGRRAATGGSFDGTAYALDSDESGVGADRVTMLPTRWQATGPSESGMEERFCSVFCDGGSDASGMNKEEAIVAGLEIQNLPEEEQFLLELEVKGEEKTEEHVVDQCVTVTFRVEGQEFLGQTEMQENIMGEE